MVANDPQRARKLLDKIKNDDFDVHSDFGSVINLLRSDSEDARRDAALCFEKLAERYPTNARSRKSHILQCLEDDATAVRAEALSALKKLAEENPGSVREEIPDIVDRIQDEPYVKKSALETTLVLAEEYPDDLRDHIPELIDAIESDNDSIRELAAKTVVRVTDESDIEVLRDAAKNIDGDSKRIIEERISEIQSDDGDSNTDGDGGDDDEDGLAYQEASSTELPEDYAFEDKVNRNDYFRCSLDAVDEGIRFTLALVGDEKRRRNYCRAISSDEVYVPVSIFAALGLHDNQIDWLGSNGRQEVILGVLERSSIQPEVPESEEIEDSQLNPNAKGSGEGFNVKIDPEGGDEPEAMYLDIVEMEGYLGISATPVELDDTARDLPNVSANTASAEDTLQFRIPLPIGYALDLTRETEFNWFTQDGSLLLVFADEISTDSEAPDTDEKDGTEPSNYEDIDGFLADIQYMTLPSQREIIRRKVSNPGLGPESIVEYPKVEVPEGVVEETLSQYEDVISHFTNGSGNEKEDDDDVDDREQGEDSGRLVSSDGENLEREVTREELLDAIEEVGQELGKRPALSDMKELTQYKQTDYYREFESWTAALEKAGYEYEPHNTKTEETDGVAEKTDREKDGRVLEFSKDDIKIKEIVEKPLTEGEKEVTIEDIDRSSFPIKDLNLHVRTVEVDEGRKVRLHFEPTSETESDTQYLLYFTADGTELRETREKVFGEGQKEVTIEEITWGDGPTNGIDMRVSGIKLDGDDPITPVLELSSIQKENE